MKRTRNVIVLSGKNGNVIPLLEKLQFKGMTNLKEEELSVAKFEEVLSNNKSVLCTGEIPERYKNSANVIAVINKKNSGIIVKNGLVMNLADEDVIEQFEKIADQMDWDIGDRKSDSSGLNGAPKISDCAYCRYLKGKDNYKNERTVYQSEHFFVIPTVGEFAHGYLLIIPYRHITSFGEMNEEESEDFLSVLSDVKEILQKTYNTTNFLVWENGTGNGGIGKSKSSVVHAHMHIAPTKATDLECIERNLGTELEEISYSELSKYGNHSYLLVEKGNGIWKINDNPNLYIPRQYVRQLLAQDYGFFDERWNWRKYPFYDKMKETIQQISDTMHEPQKYETFSERIKSNTRNFL